MVAKRTDYFHKIDARDKAYFIGLLYADGYIHYNTNKALYQVQLDLVDKDIVDKFSKEIFGSIRTKEKPPTKRSVLPTYRLNVCSKEMCEDLISHGCLPKKSLILKPPSIDSQYIRDFLRGHHDGDGCFACKKNRKYNSWIFHWSILSTSEFCDWVKKTLEEHLGILCSIHTHKLGYTIVKVSSREDILNLGEWLYQKNDVYLQRKYEQWLKVKSTLLNTNYRQLWKPEEIETLRLLYGSSSTDVLSDILEKTPKSIRSQAKRYRLSKDSFWTDTEINYLHSNYDKLSIRELSNTLGRSEHSVRAKLYRLVGSSHAQT
jgi:hypothetical protein